ncbi:hypothetical protein AVEN_275144-1 [Araneus ventricosus]|uniref:Uncharacterized protein n=1 Tax=Araneus ventricosus TaxID=182803 RepID=A0A4Y2LIX8_ARAVE|nr:hypothetical protein AVEN_275144-1 [Araneus ventricosus]
MTGATTAVGTKAGALVVITGHSPTPPEGETSRIRSGGNSTPHHQYTHQRSEDPLTYTGLLNRELAVPTGIFPSFFPALTSSSLVRAGQSAHTARRDEEVLDRCSLAIRVQSQQLFLDELLLTFAHVSEGHRYLTGASLSWRSENSRKEI